jgi:hypothetical protein
VLAALVSDENMHLTKSDILETTLPIALANVCTTLATMLESLMYASAAAVETSGGAALMVSTAFSPALSIFGSASAECHVMNPAIHHSAIF